jgi:hypothetical protein
MTGPRYSIIPADAYSDDRMKDLHVRVLGILGTHTNNNGWCEVNQRVIAEKCGRSRETINRTIRDLCEFGYLDKQEQRTKANGRTINLYQVLMDRPARTQDAATPVTSTSQGVVRPEDHNPCDVATSQHNDPSFNDLSPQPPLAGGQSFASLLAEWPVEHQGNRENAEGAFSRLRGADQGRAIRLAKAAVLAFARRKERIPALVRYIRDRMFDEFDGAPDIDVDGHFVIKPGRPEWGEWLGWIRREYGEKQVEKTVMAGVFLPKTRWPRKAMAEQSNSGAVH